MCPTADRVLEMRSALERFAGWLTDVSPYHRALRTPVYLEPEAPALLRAFWEHVGWSAAVGPVAVPSSRPERSVADAQALKVIRGWLSGSRLRERWGVSRPEDVEAAVRSKLPARSRFVMVAPKLVTFTDETTGADDPPVFKLEPDGTVTPRWASYVEMLMWQTCGKIGTHRGPQVGAGGPVPGPSGREQPFAPALPGFWTLADGVWAIGPAPTLPARAAAQRLWDRVVYRSQEEYFRFVQGLPDGEIERFGADVESMDAFTVADAKRLDPERPAVSGMRRVELAAEDGNPPVHRGLVEVDGARLWVVKRHGEPTTDIYAEPGQAALVTAYLQRDALEVLERSNGRTNPFAEAPPPEAIAGSQKLHDQARKAAEGKKGKKR